jgi:hypothetical protein
MEKELIMSAIHYEGECVVCGQPILSGEPSGIEYLEWWFKVRRFHWSCWNKWYYGGQVK